MNGLWIFLAVVVGGVMWIGLIDAIGDAIYRMVEVFQ